MPCKSLKPLINPKMLLIFILLGILIATTHSATYNPPSTGKIIVLPKQVTSQINLDSGKWIKTSGATMYITSVWVNNWFNYTVSNAGTEYIHAGVLPPYVYIDGTLKSQGSGWTYSSGTVTVTGAASSASIYFGQGWRTVETWNFNVHVKGWHTVESWQITIQTQQNWHTVEMWNLNVYAHNKSWNTVESWILHARIQSWHTIESWNFKAHVPKWYTVEMWNITLHIQSPTWHTVESWMINVTAITIVPAPTVTYHLPYPTDIRNSLKVHFGNYWISTNGGTETHITITAWLVNGWLNYTTDGTGTQQLYTGGVYPAIVYINGISKTVGNGWTYSGGIITVTGATTSVSIKFGTAWHTVESWRLTVTVPRTWHTVESWNLNIHAQGWHTIESWQLKAYVQGWRNIESWTFNATAVYRWHTIESWQFSLTIPPPPPFLPPLGVTYYFRSDSATTNNVTGYYLNTVQSNNAETISDSGSAYVTGYYAFTVQLLHVDGSLSTLGDKIGTITLTSNITGYSEYLAEYWNCPERTLQLDDAFKITIYSKLGSGGWVAKASFISDQLICRKLSVDTWVFYLKVGYSPTSTSTTITFSFGQSTANSRIERVNLKPALYSEIVLWYLINGNLLGALLYGYLQLFGALFYGIILFGVCASLYVAYRKIAPVAFLFILFGGAGGIVWAFVPGPATIVAYVFLLLALAVLIWRVIR